MSCMSNKILAFILPNKLRLPRRQVFLQLLLTIERNVLVKKINDLKCLPKFFFNLDLHTDINQIRTGIGCTRFWTHYLLVKFCSCYRGHGFSVSKASWIKFPWGGATELVWVWLPVPALEEGKNCVSAIFEANMKVDKKLYSCQS